MSCKRKPTYDQTISKLRAFLVGLNYHEGKLNCFEYSSHSMSMSITINISVDRREVNYCLRCHPINEGWEISTLKLGSNIIRNLKRKQLQ